MRAGTKTELARVVAVFGAAKPHHAYLFANRRAIRDVAHRIGGAQEIAEAVAGIRDRLGVVDPRQKARPDTDT